jgi:hypothetical protein
MYLPDDAGAVIGAVVHWEPNPDLDPRLRSFLLLLAEIIVDDVGGWLSPTRLEWVNQAIGWATSPAPA